MKTSLLLSRVLLHKQNERNYQTQPHNDKTSSLALLFQKTKKHETLTWKEVQQNDPL